MFFTKEDVPECFIDSVCQDKYTMWFPQNEVADFLFDPIVKYLKYFKIDYKRMPGALSTWIQKCEPEVEYVSFVSTYGNGNVEWAVHGFKNLESEKIWTGRFWALNKDVARCEM